MPETEDVTQQRPRTTLAVVAPCFNEQESLRQFHQELSQVLDGLPDCDSTICLIDDGSTDGTSALLLELARLDDRVRAIVLSRNFGHQTALTAGMDCVRADVVITMDSDLQHPPRLIPEMLRRYRSGYDVVSTVRSDTEGVGSIKKRLSLVFYRLINLLSDTYVQPGAADYHLLSRRAHDALLQMPERHRFIRGMVAWTGLRRDFIEYVAPRRFAGQSKYSLRRMLSLALTAAVSFSTVPLTIAIRFGFLVAAAGFGYLVYSIGRYFVVGDTVPGWPSVIGTSLLLGGIQLVFIGVIGRYLALVVEEVKRRPLYVVQFDSALDDGRGFIPRHVSDGAVR